MSIVPKESAEIMWTEVLREVSKQIPPNYYDPFISPLSLREYNEDELILNAPSETIKNHVEKKYKKFLEDAMERVGGSKCKVQIFIDSEDTPISGFINQKYEEDVQNFNPDFTFEKFVVSDSNRMANFACRQVEDSPGILNPLYIHGKVGTGKTHLLHSLGESLKRKNPDYQIKYTTISDFLAEFVYMVQNRQAMDKFKQKYQSYNVLLIDDIQYLNSSAEKTQEEFFSIFNYLYDRKKQIVIAGDRPCSELPLSDKLKSRINTGTQVEIKTPEEELKISIITQKSKQLDLQITPASIDFIAKNSPNDIRAVLGALNDILLYKKTFSLLMVSDEKVKEILDTRFFSNRNIDFSAEKIIDSVCEMYTQSKKDILSKSRKSEFIIPRHICMYLLFEVCDMNKTLIGRMFQTKHTTIINAINKVNEMMSNDPGFRKKVMTIKSGFELK